ncbi:MAG: 16S rRNA (uracil(1498)-N(3))-methyltransferase [Erysipelotrichaceae bacterium]|nr:16S rRNA (uracil(1498)-N(3))-methyltransferase [Erysipelotrichaceae bacterium]
MRQYFVNGILETGKPHELSPQQSHHVCDVLRMKNDDQIRVVDDDNRVFSALLKIEQGRAFIVPQEMMETQISENEVVLCAAMIKKEKWEMIIQKACELGATVIVPLITERTIIKFDQKETAKKLERYNKIALEACQQSNRNRIVKVMEPIRLKDIDKYAQPASFVCYEKERNTLISDLDLRQPCCFAIGPEGGFSASEIELLNSKGFVSVSLGNDILRAETACLYGLSVIKAIRSM